MTRPLSSLGAPADSNRAPEIPNHQISTEDAEIFWTDGTDARSPEPESAISISPERSRKLAALLFASKDLVDGLTVKRVELPGQTCSICGLGSMYGQPVHCAGCKVGRVEAVIAELCAVPPQPIPIRQEVPQAPEPSFADASPDEVERVKACLLFCDGIPTDDLKRELPLASAERRRWHEIMYLRRALPFLPAVAL